MKVDYEAELVITLERYDIQYGMEIAFKDSAKKLLEKTMAYAHKERLTLIKTQCEKTSWNDEMTWTLTFLYEVELE